jgi:murein L,D-transpeptidase YcbB/YkuD
MYFLKRILLCVAWVILCVLMSNSLMAKSGTGSLSQPLLVNRFYEMVKQQPFWFTSGVDFPVVRHRFLGVLDSAAYLGLDKNKYHYAELAGETNIADSTEVKRYDRMITDAAISFCKDVYRGADIGEWLSNDEISGRYAAADDDFILHKLATAKLEANLSAFVASLEPNAAPYKIVKDELAKQLIAHNKPNVAQLAVSLNFYRWIYHFHFDKFVLVNIPSVTLRYYEKDNIALQMRVVAGKPSTKTPRFSSYCNQVVLYPYWNVPANIGLGELLPKFKKNPSKVDAMNMQVIDASGQVIDHRGIDWAAYDASNFPYRFRQYTGCENSLGVIKFNLTDPFDVYMHDTNFKEAFEAKSRHLSHGCIRLEKPIELGNLFLNNKLDENFVRACMTDQKPVVNRLDKAIPVFVVYLPADVDSTNNAITYYKDVYKLF